MTVEHHSFLIRIWRETTKSLAPFGEWHGEVQHIQSGCCWTFDAVESLLDVINVEDHVTVVGKSLDQQGNTVSLSIQQKKLSKKEKPS